MKIASISIRNIKGIEALDLKPGVFTLIKGDNGTGKSSVKDAILSVFQGGCDPGWLRSGAKKGSIRMEIVDDDGELVATIEKTVSVKKDGGITSALEILDSNGVPIPAAKSFVDDLSQAWAVDASSLLKTDTSTAAGRKALIAKLLELMPIRFEVAELGGVLGNTPVPDLRACDLEGVSKIRKYVEEMRRKIGIEAKEAEGSVNALRKSLPPPEEDAVDWVQRERALISERNALVASESEEKSEVQRAAATERLGVVSDFTQREQALREEFRQKFVALDDEKRQAIAGVDRAEQVALTEANAKYRPEFDRITAELATARERAAAQQRAAGVREQLDTFGARVRAKNTEYDRLSKVLENLDTLRKSKLDALPIPGIEVEGDQVRYNGVPWEHVNTAQRLVLGMQINSMTEPKLPFIVADDAEHMSERTLAEVREGLAAAGYQFVATVVDSGPLRVEQVA